MRVLQRPLLLFLLIFIGSIALAPPALATGAQGKEFVHKKAGFRVQLPPGWRKKKAEHSATFSLFIFSQSKDLVVSLMRGSEKALNLGEQLFALLPSYRKISEEEILLSGLPAKKTIYGFREGNKAERRWRIEVSSKGETWSLTVMGSEEILGSPDNPRYQEVQQLIDSFEFLEPVLARLRAGLPDTKVAVSETGQRYYVNDELGIKILLPQEWELASEEKPSFARGQAVVLGRPGTLARVGLGREMLEASPELYKRLVEKHVIQATDNYRKLTEEKVSRSGLEGTKILCTATDHNIKVRYWVEIFSVENQHFRITAWAPEEVFDRYADTFSEMMSSVQFLGLGEKLPAAEIPPPSLRRDRRPPGPLNLQLHGS